METELMRLGRPPPFEGEEEKWAEWAFQARAYLSLLGDVVADDLAAAEQVDEEPPMSDMGDRSRVMSRKCFYALTMLVRGPPLGILRQIENANGYEAWRRLVRRFDSNLAGRQHNLLQSVLKPRPFGANATEWEDRAMT